MARHDTRPDRRVCHVTGKLKYDSPRAAEKRRKTIKVTRDERLSAFRCPHCRKWHLGHDYL